MPIAQCDREDKPFRISALRRDIQQIADEEQRTITQICEMLLNEGVRPTRRKDPSSYSAWLPSRRPGLKTHNLATGGVLHVAGAPIRSLFQETRASLGRGRCRSF